jgi:lipoprotein LpqH
MSRVLVTIVTITFGVVLVGCSKGSSGDVGSQASSARPSSAATDVVKVVVDGQTRSVQNKIECVTAANMVMANIGSEQDAIATTMSAGDNPKLIEITLGMVDGKPFTYNDSDPGPMAAVTKTGSTYELTGRATTIGSDGLKTVGKSFDVTFTCPPSR